MPLRARGRLADERFASAALDALHTPVALLDSTGTITYVNAAWRAAASERGLAVGSCEPGDSYLQACGAAAKRYPCAAFVLRGLSRMLAGKATEFDRVCQLFDEQRRRAFRVRIKRLRASGRTAMLVSSEEITALTEAQDEVQDMAERLLVVQAEERRRLALELHDSVGQDLVSVGLGLSRLRILAPHSQGLSSVIGDIADSLQQAHAQIRSLSYLLNPPWPEEGGRLESAVREFVEGFGRRADLQVEVQVTGAPFELDRVREIALFRILQEALVNVHRHAKADVVVVQLTSQHGEVKLGVRDNGRGFSSVEGHAPHLGVGLSSMQTRVGQLGGELKIVTGPSGTRVAVTIPRSGVRERASPEQPCRAPEGLHDEAPPALGESRSWDPPEPRRPHGRRRAQG
jgi:signal transduction histidine kinase